MNCDTLSIVFSFLDFREVTKISSTCKLFYTSSQNLGSYYECVYTSYSPIKEVWKNARKVRWNRMDMPFFELHCNSLYIGHDGNPSIVNMCPNLTRLSTKSGSKLSTAYNYSNITFLNLRGATLWNFVQFYIFPNLQELCLEDAMVREDSSFPISLKKLNIVNTIHYFPNIRFLPNLEELLVSNIDWYILKIYTSSCRNSLKYLYIEDPIENFKNIKKYFPKLEKLIIN